MKVKEVRFLKWKEYRRFLLRTALSRSLKNGIPDFLFSFNFALSSSKQHPHPVTPDDKILIFLCRDETIVCLSVCVCVCVRERERESRRDSTRKLGLRI